MDNELAGCSRDRTDSYELVYTTVRAKKNELEEMGADVQGLSIASETPIQSRGPNLDIRGQEIPISNRVADSVTVCFTYC